LSSTAISAYDNVLGNFGMAYSIVSFFSFLFVSLSIGFSIIDVTTFIFSASK
jgi:hypothetical protein